MVTISIIGLLTAVSLLAFNRQQTRSRDAKRIKDIDDVHLAIESYINEFNEPLTTAAIGADTEACGWDVSSKPASNPTWASFLSSSGYMETIPLDPINTLWSGGASGCNESALNYYYYYYTTEHGSYGLNNGRKAYVIFANLEGSINGESKYKYDVSVLK